MSLQTKGTVFRVYTSDGALRCEILPPRQPVELVLARIQKAQERRRRADRQMIALALIVATVVMVPICVWLWAVLS